MVIVLLLATTLVGVREGVRWTLEAELDRLLKSDASEVRLMVERYQPDWATIGEELQRKALTHADNGWFARLTRAGRTLAESGNAPEIREELPASPVGKAGRYEVATYRWDGPGGPVDILVGVDRSPLTEDVARLSRMLALAGGIVTVLAPLTGWWLAGRATRPLANIISATARLHPDKLDERLAVRGTGDELDRLSETINHSLDRIHEYLVRQREFVANSAHELRSPLTAVRTALEVALDRDRPAEEYRELLGELAERCQGLSDLINRLLLLAEGDVGRVHSGAAVCDLAAVAARSVEMFQVIAEQRSIRLESELQPAPVRGEATRLAQLTNNLVDNALKFTPAGGTIRVRTSATADAVWLTVEDTGPGIPREDLPRVFDRFFTGDRSRRRGDRVGGTGLGLSICRAVAEGYGGKIELFNNRDGGATAAVKLPGGNACNLTAPTG